MLYERISTKNRHRHSVASSTPLADSRPASSPRVPICVWRMCLKSDTDGPDSSQRCRRYGHHRRGALQRWKTTAQRPLAVQEPPAAVASRLRARQLLWGLSLVDRKGRHGLLMEISLSLADRLSPPNVVAQFYNFQIVYKKLNNV